MEMSGEMHDMEQFSGIPVIFTYHSLTAGR
jgi:hypothetical protein